MATPYSQPDSHILLVSILNRLDKQSAIVAAREAEIKFDNLVNPSIENESSFRIGIATTYFRLSQVIEKEVLVFLKNSYILIFLLLIYI